jgi:hypothetical protein
MQFHAIGLLFIAKTMAVQTHTVGHVASLFDVVFMTGIIAACLVGNKLSMVNCHESTFDHFIRHLMAILAAGLNQPIATFIVLEEMTRKTRIVVHTEVFVPFEVAVARAARNSYPVNYFFDVILVSELDTAVVDIFC